MDGLVYINRGRVIVDCPFGCGNAYTVHPQETVKMCFGASDSCGFSFSLVIPSNIGELMQELDRRPDKKNRNWYPVGHPVAEAHGFAQDQTVADLATEFEEEAGT